MFLVLKKSCLKIMRGFKKPLNNLENPILPNIQQGPPKFGWSKKFWQVDTGKAMLENEHYPMLVEGNGVLIQSRDYNQSIYGISSHKDVVNLNFRPPPRTIDDVLPLSRQPRKRVVPTINPETAGMSTNAYTAKNEFPSELDAYIQDRIKGRNGIRPTYFLPVDLPIESNVIPDLHVNMPVYSVSAGYNPQMQFNAPLSDISIDFKKLPISGESGVTVPLSLNPIESFTYVDLESRPKNIPQGALSSGVTPQYRSSIEPIEYDLDYKTPVTSISAGYTSNFQTSVEVPELSLERNLPEISTSAGMNVNFRSDNTYIPPDMTLSQSKLTTSLSQVNPESLYKEANAYVKPDITLSRSKLTTPIQINPTSSYRESNYTTKPNTLGKNKLTTPITQINPDSLYRENNYTVNPTKTYNGNPKYSYTIPQEFGYVEDNRNKPAYRKKQDSQGSYFGYQNRTYIPRAGIGIT